MAACVSTIVSTITQVSTTISLKNHSSKSTTVRILRTDTAHREQVADLVLVGLGDGERAAVVVALAVGENFEVVVLCSAIVPAHSVSYLLTDLKVDLEVIPVSTHG